MNPSQPQYFSARTILEREGGKKFVFIDHPVYGQHRFSLPTIEEISKDYSYYSKSSKKKWINSFMIFRTYLQKSKQKEDYLILGEVSKIASEAWSFATQDVLDACGELETNLRESFKYQRFVPYSNHNPKKSKKNRSTSKKESSSPCFALPPSRDQIYYPSPPMIAVPPPIIATPPPVVTTPMLPPDHIIYSTYLYTPLETPMCDTIGHSEVNNMPLLALPPPLEEITSMFSVSSSQNQLSSLTPSQILTGPNQSFLGNGFSSSISLQIPEEGLTVPTVPTQFNLTLNETVAESDYFDGSSVNIEFESLNLHSISPEDGQNEHCEYQI
ncbi:hypothetical protein RclHR1_06090006 [Rhizophagus clarus]|nr:hypothetical protein RclHR1_06090006 [Rhizophagus clarus]